MNRQLRSTMLYRRAFSVLALLLSALCLAGCPPQKPTKTAAALPQIEVKAASGESVSLNALTHGKVAVIDLWATWCEPCKENLPRLERLANAYEKAGLLVIGVDVGEENFEAVQEYMRSVPITYPVYYDPEFRFADSLGDDKVPTVLVLDKNGRIVHRARELDQPTMNAIRAQLGI